jgi:hypothetical protein
LSSVSTSERSCINDVARFSEFALRALTPSKRLRTMLCVILGIVSPYNLRYESVGKGDYVIVTF